MTRFLLWLAGGVVLGGIIHLVVILTLPRLAEDTISAHIAALDAADRMVILPPVEAGQPNPLGLDPALIYGVCSIDLTAGPAYLNGVLPEAPWSVALFKSDGVVAYSTTNRDGINQTLKLGIFNAAQTRLLAQQTLDVPDGLLVVEADVDQLFALVRLIPPHDVMRPRFAEALSKVTCGPRL
ncbi:DUF1254 domain-containing protein [Devosia aquimaris]|uniref:DUF1254 domain-containing protein n=1 Tax=Devosia aquimaris TaxID=2866214 RepID=UPI001CD0B276|nr:hypothetical protein [Devosia sp. CJK-A8-3]